MPSCSGDGPGALEIVGEAGIGKTRLLGELGTRADARGWLVLAGSASELEDDLPFCVFVEALDDYVRGLDPRRLAEFGEEVAAELPHVLPSLPVPVRRGATLQIEPLPLASRHPPAARGARRERAAGAAAR